MSCNKWPVLYDLIKSVFKFGWLLSSSDTTLEHNPVTADATHNSTREQHNQAPLPPPPIEILWENAENVNN